MIVRRAQLEDTLHISELFCSRIDRWQRLNADGTVQDMDYAQLSLYEHWQHGGQWMNHYTATLWLSHVLRGAGLPWVVEEDQRIVAYGEVFPGHEAAPFGRHWHIGQLITLAGYAEMRDPLMQAILQEAANAGRITVNLFSYDEENVTFYGRYGLTPLDKVFRYEVKTQMGQGFYRTVEHPNADVSQINEWVMPLGRISSASQQWQHLWPGVWDAIPQIAGEKVLRVRMSASGQEAFVCCKQDLFDPRLADVYCWSNKAASAALLVAVRDWAHRAGYRSLTLWGDASLGKLLGDDAEQSAQQRVILARTL